MLPPANLGKKQNVIKRVSNCASCYRINSHHPTDHDRTLLRLQLHWLCGLRSSQNHRTLLEFICFAFGNNQWDVQSLSKLSRMYVCWLMFIAGLWLMRCFGNLGAKKTKSSNRKTQYGTCRLFTRTTWHVVTCSVLLPGLEPIQGLPFPQWHQDFTYCKINGLESGKPGCHRPHRTSSTLKMSPSCQGILHHLNRHTMMSVQIPPTAEIDQALSSCLLSYWETRDQHLYLFAFIIYILWAERLRAWTKLSLAYRVTAPLTRRIMDRKGRWHGETSTSFLTRFCLRI